MQNVKKEKVNSISDILEEIVRCVTAPSFCVMPWKCVTMAVGDRTDPIVKKSVVHIYRTCVDGQNIFQIKVHNCKKEVCDHAICTKDCEATQPGTERAQNETNKRKRKKRNKYPDVNKDTTLGCCLLNKVTGDEWEKVSDLREHKDSKHRNASLQKNKRTTKKSENREKPSCTLQIFAEGKSRKLNFQLHPAMKIFLGKALDRLEYRDAKEPKESSTSYTMPEYCQELLGKTNDSCKTKLAKTMKKLSTNSSCCNKNRRTESVEEFEINLPDNTNNAKDRLVDLRRRCSLSEMSMHSCHCDRNPIFDNMGNDGICPEMKIEEGHLSDCIIPAQQSHKGLGKSDKETLTVRTELHPLRTPEKLRNEKLTTDDTHQKTTKESISEHHHGMGIKYNRSDRELVGNEERFHSSDRHSLIFQDHQADICTSKYDNIGMKTKMKPNPNETFWNISCGNVNPPQSYSNSSRCFQNRAGDNMIGNPYVVDYHSDNNGRLVNDVRNMNNRNYSISGNRAPIHSSDYINSSTIYRSNTRIYPPPIVHESFSMSPDYGTFLTNDGVYSNRLYGNQQHYNYANHGGDFMNTRDAPRHLYEMPDNQHDVMFPKERVDRETQISHEGSENVKGCSRFNRYHARVINVYPESEKRIFFRETNKPEPGQYLEDVPTSTRNRGNMKERIRNIYDYQESIDNNIEGKRRFHRQGYLHASGMGAVSEIRTSPRPGKLIKRKNCKESEKSNSNSDRNCNAPQHCNLPSCSNVIESKTSSNKENMLQTSNTDKNSSDSTRRKENKRFSRRAKKNRKEKNNTDEGQLLHNTNKIMQNSESTTHPDYKIINESEVQYRSEEENSFERLNFGKFEHIRPSNILSEDKLMSGLIRNRMEKTEHIGIARKNGFHHRKTSKESLIFKSTPSIQTADSSNHLVEDMYINHVSEKSSDISSFCVHFPRDYSGYQFISPARNKNGWEHLAREKINVSNGKLRDDDYDSDSNYFCYPSQISWDHYGNFQHIIPNVNRQQDLKYKDTKTYKRVEPSKNIVTEGDSSKLCHACSKALNEDKAGKSFENSYANERVLSHSCSKDLIKNNLQYKDVTNLEKPNGSKNDLIPNKDMDSCNLTNLNLNGVRNTINSSLPKAAIDNHHQHNNADRCYVKKNIPDIKDLKEQSSTMKSENLQKKQSKVLHSESVKKFFSHAKEYINFGKYSTSNIRSGPSNEVLHATILNSASQSVVGVDKAENQPRVGSKHSVEAPGVERNSDFYSVDIKQSSDPAKACSENNDVPQSADLQGLLSSRFKPTEVCRNNTMLAHPHSNTKMFKTDTYANSQANLKDDKYRLYGSNEIAKDHSSTEGNELKFIKNEYKILQSESECEGFSDDIYCYSSSEWQSEVAKNWVATTKNKYIKHDRFKMSLKKNDRKSVFSLRSDFSNCKIEKEKTCENSNKKPMINATIALSPDNKKGKKNKHEIEHHLRVSQCSTKKSENRFSNLFSNSIKNNYKKIKGLVKKNCTQQKNKSATRVYILRSPSFTDTQSQSFITPMTSAYSATRDGGTTAETENSGVKKFCKESTINNYISDSNYAKSDPIIRQIEPGTWRKFVSRTLSVKSTEISETENVETENSSISDISIEESSLQVLSNERNIHPIGRFHGLNHSHRHSVNHFSESDSPVLRIGSDSFQTNHQVLAESMYECDQTDESTLNLSNCFQNPMVDPKTGFRPSFPTST